MFKHRTCLYWFEFAPIIMRARRVGRSLRIYAPNHLNIVTIVDGTRPKRDVSFKTGISDTDWLRDSIICNSAWENGCIPIISIQGRTWENEAGDEFVQRPVRGVKGTLAMLLDKGCIKETFEVKELMKCWR